MATSTVESSPGGLLGPDPGRATRCWVALFLRIGVGLSLLSIGLAGYFGQRGATMGAGAWGQNFGMGGLDPFFSAIPYLAIGLGLALILGFLTTASAIGAAFFSLLMPAFAIVQIVSMGASGGMMRGGGWGNDPFLVMMMAMSLPNMIPMAALIWLSPLENHPHSIDALIFGRNEMETFARPEFSPSTTPEPAREPELENTIHIGE
jgi:uncharacterized membrane protein YphA (DoxX/SURF4 family)